MSNPHSPTRGKILGIPRVVTDKRDTLKLPNNRQIASFYARNSGASLRDMPPDFSAKNLTEARNSEKSIETMRLGRLRKKSYDMNKLEELKKSLQESASKVQALYTEAHSKSSERHSMSYSLHLRGDNHMPKVVQKNRTMFSPVKKLPSITQSKKSQDALAQSSRYKIPIKNCLSPVYLKQVSDYNATLQTKLSRLFD